MGWQWQKGKTLNYLIIEEWAEKGVTAAFSSRSGGLSNGPYTSLNIGLHVEDKQETVLANRKRLLDEWSIPFEDCVVADQVHGRHIQFITGEDRGKGMESTGTAIPSTDGMLTNSGIALMAFFADCVPVFFFHPDIRIIGLAHAGWKGTASGIAGKMIEKISSYGGHPSRCLVGIGPCIGKCCYEVDENVIEAINEKVLNIARVAAPVEKNESAKKNTSWTWRRQIEKFFSLGEFIPQTFGKAECVLHARKKIFTHTEETTAGRAEWPD